MYYPCNLVYNWTVFNSCLGKRDSWARLTWSWKVPSNPRKKSYSLGKRINGLMCVTGIRGSPRETLVLKKWEHENRRDEAVHSGIRSSSNTLFILLGICLVTEMKESWCWKQKEVRISLGMADMKKKFSKSCCGYVGAEILGNLDSSPSVEVRWCSSFLTCILASETWRFGHVRSMLPGSIIKVFKDLKPVHVRRSYWYKDMLEKDKHYYTEIVFTLLTEVLKNFF